MYADETCLIVLVRLVLVTLFIGWIPALIAKRKGRDFWIWWMYGGAFFLIALIHSILIKPLPKGEIEGGVENSSGRAAVNWSAATGGSKEGGSQEAQSAALKAYSHLETLKEREILSALRSLCRAYEVNDRATVAELEPLATLLGEELNRRGGFSEMNRVWARLENIRGTRNLAIHWNGIGEWHVAPQVNEATE